MIHLTSWPLIVVEFGLAVFCFLDVVLMREAQVRWMPRAVWALFLLCFPVAGSIGWIAAGRPWRHHKPIPDDIAPDEPTRPGDPFHHDTSPLALDDLAPDDEAPSRDQRRSRERPPRRQPPEDPPDRPAKRRPPGNQEPAGPPEAEREPEERHRAPGPAHDERPGHGRGRWRWHGRPHSRSGRPGGPVGSGNVPASRPDDVTPPTVTPPTGTPPPNPRTLPVGLPIPRPDLAAPDGTRDPATGLIGELFAVHEEHERTLRRWEEDLRRREQELRRHQGEERAEPPE
jgi:hypothetical protein